MRKIKWVSSVLLLVLLFSAAAGITIAQEPPLDDPHLPNLPGLSSFVSEWTDDELEQLVDLIIKGRITVQQSQIIYEQLTEEQITKVGELLAIKVGIPLDEARQAMAERRRKEIHGFCSISMLSGRYLWGCYLCEYAGRIVRNSTKSDYAGEGYECGSKDKDYLPHFPINYERNPDLLRWYTDDGRVYWCFRIFYGLNLNSFAYNWAGWDRGVWLVLGKTGVICAGGINRVRAHQYVALSVQD